MLMKWPKRVCAAAAAETAAHVGDNNTPSGPTGGGVKDCTDHKNNEQV